ncbi:MAG: hypothetical protein J7639_17020 [Paenibacillaceae bacterium]|nr:hypothetical protein [Paenibacillaceae bacterium]
MKAETWSQRRTMGRKKYVLRYGILTFGFGIALLLTLLELVTQGTFHYTLFVIRLLLFPIIGLIWFASRWDALERKFFPAEAGKLHE